MFITFSKQGEILQSEAVPDSIKAVVVEEDGFPNAYAGSLFFGLKDFIIINQSMVKLLDDRQLDALLAHEIYHLQNRDWAANLLAGIFSLLFFGRNTLLVFWGYPSVEREADKYAADRVGVEPLQSALHDLTVEKERYRRLRERHLPDESQRSKPSLPGFWTIISNTVSQRRLQRLTELQRYITDPYELLFGSIVFQSAHLNLDDRRNRLEDL